MKKITHPRLKNQIVGPLLVALHAECYNILNSCSLCYLDLVCNIPFTGGLPFMLSAIMLNSCRRCYFNLVPRAFFPPKAGEKRPGDEVGCYLYLVCNILFTNLTVYFIKKTNKQLKKIVHKGFVTFISPR